MTELPLGKRPPASRVQARHPALRHIAFAGFVAAGVLLYWGPLVKLSRLSMHNELYSHFLLIPFVSLFFLYVQHTRCFEVIQPARRWGLPVILTGIAVMVAGYQFRSHLSPNDFLSLCLTGMVCWINGGFLWFYGQKAYREALFPLLFLVFTIPIPDIVLEPVVRLLQVGSAHAVNGAFTMIGIPYFRDDMVFQLSGITIEVAKECSGIRSSLILVITSTIAGYMFLESAWRRIVLILAIIPLTIFKNALRITTLSLLASYVDPHWITGSWLHRSGGIVFFLIALAVLAPLLWYLKRSEIRTHEATNI